MISTAVVCLVQASAFLVNRGWYKSVLEFVVVIAITMVILLWIVLLFAIPGERQDQVLMEEVRCFTTVNIHKFRTLPTFCSQ